MNNKNSFFILKIIFAKLNNEKQFEEVFYELRKIRNIENFY